MHGSDMTAREQRIRERAHKLWEQAGKPDGQDDIFWYEAEVQIGIEDKERPDPPVSRGGFRR